jgi:hypothetical protein
MMPVSRRVSLAAIALIGLAAASPALARPGGWGGSRWDRDPFSQRDMQRSGPSRPVQDRSREGRVQVDRFVGEGDAASLLGHGTIAVTSQAPNSGQDDEWVGPGGRAAFEAAVVDSLAHAGYRTDAPAVAAGQTVELRIARAVLVPAEAKRSPVSGEAAMEVGNRGSAYGLALNVDLTKPLPALLSTRMEARIRDRASGRLLWEGRAEVATREGSETWTEAKIASKLAEALFDGFPLVSEGLKAGG